MEYAGADWLKANGVKNISPFGERVANLIGYLYQGIYHVNGVERKDWANPYHVSLTIRGDLSTFDNSLLTTLVLLAHRMAIRVTISPCTPQLLLLRFDERKREGHMWDRHPTIGQAIANHNEACYIPKFEDQP